MKIKINYSKLWSKAIFVVIVFLILWLIVQGVIYPKFNAKSISFAINNSIKSTGRNIYINGTVTPSLFPSPNISIQKISLTDKDGKTIAAKAGKLNIGLSWWSLLKGDYVINKLEINDASLTMERFANGTLSFQDLLKNNQNTKYKINLNKLKIKNGFLAVIDMSSNNISIVDSINLNAIGLLNQQAKLTASARFYNGQQKIKFNLSSPLNIYKNKIYINNFNFYAMADIGSFAKTNLHMNGNLILDFNELQANGKNIIIALQNNLYKSNLTINAPSAYIDFNSIKSKSISLFGSFTNKTDKYKFNGILENILYKNEIFDASNLNGQLIFNSDKNTMGFAISAPLHIEKQSFQLAPMALSVNTDTKFLQKNNLEAKLIGKINGSFNDKVFLFYAYGKLDESNITIGIQQKGLFNPYRSADISLDNFNLNHYLPVDENKSKELFISKKPINMDWLDSENFDANLNIGNLFIGGLQINNIMASAKAKSGVLHINNIKAKIYGGTLDGEVILKHNKNISIEVNQLLTNVNIKPVLLGLVNFGGFDATGDSTIKINAKGDSFYSLRHSLAGNVSLNLNNGYLSGVDVISAFKDKQSKPDNAINKIAINSDKSTSFDKLLATIKIKNGIATNKDLILSSQLLNINGHGEFDLVNGIVDYTMNVKTNSKTLDHKKNFNVPLKITGPINSPIYSLDFNTIVSGKKTKIEKQNAINKALKKQIDTILP